MTDIRKAAQAVLDEAENPFGQLPDFMTALEALRQALAEPVKPVVVQVNGHVFHRDGKQFIQFEQKSPSVDVPRFHLNENDLPPFLDKLVRPVEPVASCQGLLDSSRPSIDALIAEAVAKEREDIAEAVSQCNPRATPKGIAAAIRARGQK